MGISINRGLYEEMLLHAKGDYPHECCGLIAGRYGEQVKEAVCIYPVQNKNNERLNDRYSIDPADMLKIEKEVKRKGLQILGFYHSHPDHPSRPSQFDRDRAWPVYTYIIIAVASSGEVKVRSWVLSDDESEFIEEEIRLEA